MLKHVLVSSTQNTIIRNCHPQKQRKTKPMNLIKLQASKPDHELTRL